jgi:hypothetical protein
MSFLLKYLEFLLNKHPEQLKMFLMATIVRNFQYKQGIFKGTSTAKYDALHGFPLKVTS